MESKYKIMAAATLILVFLVVGSYWIISGRAEGDITKEEAMRLAENEINERTGDLSADAISAEREADTEEGSDEAYYDVIVQNSEGYWEVEVYCKDGSIGEVEGPTSNPDP